MKVGGAALLALGVGLASVGLGNQTLGRPNSSQFYYERDYYGDPKRKPSGKDRSKAKAGRKAALKEKQRKK